MMMMMIIIIIIIIIVQKLAISITIMTSRNCMYQILYHGTVHYAHVVYLIVSSNNQPLFAH